jgi:hypothetical protein
MTTRNTRRSTTVDGKLAPVTFTGVQDIGNQSMLSALRGSAFAQAALEVWPELAKDFAKGDDENWKLFDAGAIAAYDRNNAAPYVLRGEDATYMLATSETHFVTADDIPLTAAYLRSLTPADWRNHKDNAPTLYALCKERKEVTDNALRNARRILRDKIAKHLKGPAETRASNSTFVEAIRKLAEEGLKKCTSKLAKKDGEVSDDLILTVRVELQALLKKLA